jgi:hypothetical protein
MVYYFSYPLGGKRAAEITGFLVLGLRVQNLQYTFVAESALTTDCIALHLVHIRVS